MRLSFLLLGGTAVLFGLLASCGDDDAGGGPTDDAGTDAPLGADSPNDTNDAGDGSSTSNPGLDPTFGTNGVFTTGFGGGSLASSGIVRQADGKLVILGNAYDGDLMMLSRFDANGQLDPTFGEGGNVLVPAGKAIDPGGIGLTADGKLVVSGASRITREIILARVLATGALDTTFGTNGLARTAAGTESQGIYRLRIQSDGKIVVAGGYGADAKVVRFTSDGKLDPTFASNGVAPMGLTFGVIRNLTLDGQQRVLVSGADNGVAIVRRFSTSGVPENAFTVLSNADAVGVVVQADGKIIAAGRRNPTGSFVARLDATGALDNTWDGDGVLQHNNFFEGVTLQPDGKVITCTNYAIRRFDTLGAPDPTFVDATGTLNLSLPRTIATIVDPNGNIFLAGEKLNGAGVGQYNAIGISKVKPTGEIDLTFGTAGLGSSAPKIVGDVALAVKVAPSGSIIATGWGGDGTNPVLRLDATGKLDPTFGNGGLAGPSAPLNTTDLVVDAMGRPLFFHSTSSFGNVALKRLGTNGQADPSFGQDGGVSEIPVGTATSVTTYAMTLDPSQKPIITGRASGGSVDGVFAMRLLPEGGPDPAFGGTGYAITDGESGHSVAAQADSKVLVAGKLDSQNMAVWRFEANGSLDGTFGMGGVAKTIVVQGNGNYVRARHLALQSDGKIIVLATTHPDREDFVVLRYTAQGELDTSFGTAGKIIDQATAGLQHYQGNRPYEGPGLAVAADGSIYVGTAALDAGDDEMALLKYTPAGQPDTTFGPGGLRRITSSLGADAVRSLAIQSDGKLVLGGRMFTKTGGSDFAVLRVIP